MTTQQAHQAGAADPWTMSLEEALALPDDLDDTRGRTWQFVTAQNIADQRAAIEAGDGRATMTAVTRCIEVGLPVPAWLAALFMARHKAGVERSSWDHPDAFDRPHPRYTHLARVRKDASAGPVVYFLVRKILADDPEQKIDDSLFEKVAKKLRKKSANLSASECRRVYYSFKPAPGLAQIVDANLTKLASIRRQK